MGSLARPSNNIELNFSKQYTVNKDAIVEAAEKLDFKHYNRKIIDECVSNFHQRELKFSEGVKELASLFRKLIQTDHGSGIRAGGTLSCMQIRKMLKNQKRKKRNYRKGNYKRRKERRRK